MLFFRENRSWHGENEKWPEVALSNTRGIESLVDTFLKLHISKRYFHFKKLTVFTGIRKSENITFRDLWDLRQTWSRKRIIFEKRGVANGRELIFQK